MNNLKLKILELSKKYYDEALEIRRHIHQNPELSTEEFQTAQYISNKLTEWNIEHKTQIANTGIVGLLKFKNQNKKIVALRADMDALPIFEKNTCSYKSKNHGVMHACGHDVHIASLLITLKILNELKEELQGSIKFIFQPSEEKYPGGAIQMINEGVLDNPKPDLMLGMHVMPGLGSGVLGLKNGKYMASTDEIYLTVKGKGGHAANPQENIDPITISAQLIIALQQIVSRFAPPTIPSVLSFGRIEGLGKTNIIPNEVKIEGTFRTFDENWRKKAHQLIKNISENTCKAFNADVDVLIARGYPFLTNDEVITNYTKKFAIDYLGADKVKDIELRMTAEDFAYYSQIIPATFYRIGCDIPDNKEIRNLHSDNFDIYEPILEQSIGAMSYITSKFLLENI